MTRLASTAVALVALACGGKHNDSDRDARPGDAGTGGTSSTWEGAPCEECNLQTQVPLLAAPGSQDCGEIPLDTGNADAVACAHAALREGRDFTLIVEHQGTDSNVKMGWVQKASLLYGASYDSNVCGGGGTCDSMRCGPRVVSFTCVDPTGASDPTWVLDCREQAGMQTLCGPAPTL